MRAALVWLRGMTAWAVWFWFAVSPPVPVTPPQIDPGLYMDVQVEPMMEDE